MISRGLRTDSSSASACRPSAPAYSARGELAGRQIEQRDADRVLDAWRHRHQERRLARVEIVGIGQRAGETTRTTSRLTSPFALRGSST